MDDQSASYTHVTYSLGFILTNPDPEAVYMPPTGWQRLKSRIAEYGDRLVDAWDVLRGKAYAEWY